MIYILFMQLKLSFSYYKYWPEASVQQRKSQKNDSCSSSKKRKHKAFKSEIPSLNLHRKAESVEVIDKGLTTNIFTFYFFQYSSKTPRQSFSHPNILFTFASPDLLSSLKVFFTFYEVTLMFMINNLNKGSKKSITFIITFIFSNFFQNSSGHNTRLSSC